LQYSIISADGTLFKSYLKQDAMSWTLLRLFFRWHKRIFKTKRSVWKYLV